VPHAVAPGPRLRGRPRPHPGRLRAGHGPLQESPWRGSGPGV